MDYIIEPERKIPVKAEYDTVVAGGGIAGIAAAAAAARGGARVLLIEKQYMPGGLATAGLVTIFLPLVRRYGQAGHLRYCRGAAAALGAARL